MTETINLAKRAVKALESLASSTQRAVKVLEAIAAALQEEPSDAGS